MALDIIDRPAAGNIANTAVVYSGTATTVAAEVDFSTEFDAENIYGVAVHNTDALTSLLVSFDGESTWKAVGAGQVLSLQLSRAAVDVKTAAATATYEILVSGV